MMLSAGLFQTLLLLLHMSPAFAMRYGTALESSSDLGESCPKMCRSFNFAFMKTAGKSPSELQREVNKKCKYSFCSECSGGGGFEGIPCCTSNCEFVEEERSVAIEGKAASALANHAVEDVCLAHSRHLGESKLELNSLKAKFDPWDLAWGVGTVGAVALSYIFNFNDPWSVWYVPYLDEEPPQDSAVYTPLATEECEFLPGALWCPGESYSPGTHFHQGVMHPLCCTEVEQLSTTSTTTLELGGYIPLSFERCEYISWVFWCPGDMYNPGWQYSRAYSQPLCCEVVDYWRSTTRSSTTTTTVMQYTPQPWEDCKFVTAARWCPGDSFSPGSKYNRGSEARLCCEIDDSYWSTSVATTLRTTAATTTEAAVTAGTTTAIATAATTTEATTTATAATTTEAPVTAATTTAVTAPPSTTTKLPIATASDIVGYKAIKGEKCWHESGRIRGRKFCPLPAYNVGPKYENEGGDPLCCQRMSSWYVSDKEDDVEEMADNFLTNFTHVPKSVDDVPLLREPDCPDHKEFVLQKYKLNCREKTICIDKHSGRPEDKICCSKRVKEVNAAMSNYNTAVEACSTLKFASCATAVKGVRIPPSGFACERMYWCVNKKAGSEERVGPVAHPSMCKDLYLMPKQTCGAIKVD